MTLILFALQRCDIETGWVPDSEKNKGTGPNTYDLLWFRLAKGEKLHFSEVHASRSASARLPPIGLLRAFAANQRLVSCVPFCCELDQCVACVCYG
jgi:hypothetical protein